MLDHFFRRPRVRDRLRANPLGARIEAYVAYLDARGHPRGTIQPYVHAVEHFGAWLTSEHLAIEDVSQATPPPASAPLPLSHPGPDSLVSGPSRLGSPSARPRRPSHAIPTDTGT